MFQNSSVFGSSLHLCSIHENLKTIRRKTITRMDDPELEWETEEYKSAEVSCDNGKVNWMLKIGKKILTTGIVLSTAPLVLPPLVAISAVGMVCSVPYGVLLASYACSKMVMNRLLPMSSPADWDEKQREQNEVFKYMEEELKEDIIEESGMKIKLVDQETEELDDGNILQAEAYQKVDVENDRKESMVESEHEEDDGEFLDEERPSQSFYIQIKDIERSDEQPIEEESRGERPEENYDAEEYKYAVETTQTDAKENLLKEEEETTEGEYKQPFMDETSHEQPVSYVGGLEGSKSRTYSEVDNEKRAETVNVGGVRKQSEEIMGKTTEVKEQCYTRDESMSEQPIEEVHNILIMFEGDEKSIQKEKPLQIKNIAVQLSQSTDLEEDKELVRETRGLLEKIRDEGKNDHIFGDKWTTAKEHVGAAANDEKIEDGNITISYDTSKETSLGKDIEGSSEKMVVDNIPPVGTVNDGNITEELMGKSTVLMEGGLAEYANENNVEQDYQLKREKKDVIFSHEDEKETNEQALDQLEDVSTVSQQGSPSDVNTFEELSVSTRPHESDEILISAENSTHTASDESLYSEEKLKEHIEALRTIIGYEVNPRETSAEELKALYLFTGIEPPPLKDASDIVELNSKLRYLMSVVGVK